jgi:hypothetical protein
LPDSGDVAVVPSGKTTKAKGSPRVGAPRQPDAVQVLQRFIEAVESGELLDRTPQDAAVVRHLQGKLTALQDDTIAHPAPADRPALSGRR